jgi:hypothetical protein
MVRCLYICIINYYATESIITTVQARMITENTIQKVVMSAIRAIPRLESLIFHIPNEGRRTYNYGRHLQSMGMRRGVADLFIALQRHGYGGAWIELKSAKGILSPVQKEFLHDMRQQQYFTAVCYTIEDAIKTISWYTGLVLPMPNVAD